MQHKQCRSKGTTHMISKRTVFVLGAGASMAYGFPSGPGLRHEIVTQTLKPKDPRHEILKNMGYSLDELQECRVALARSWASSIDMFIASRDDFADVAKAAIVLTIAKYEINQKLFFGNPGEDWFRYLWRFLHDPNGEPLQTDRISFVTFNYDRTLEHSLANGLKYAYNVLEVTADMLPSIVHVYGSLGSYPYSDTSGWTRDFATRSTEDNIIRSRDSIKVISENASLDSTPAQTRAHALLEQAEQVIFLGFGYDEDNLRTLRLLKDDYSLTPSCHVRGTAMHVTVQERFMIQSIMGRDRNHKPIRFGDDDMNCLMYLRESVRLLSSG
jgi:hypothetical protein